MKHETRKENNADTPDKEQRLKAALKANMAKRKAQAKVRAAAKQEKDE